MTHTGPTPVRPAPGAFEQALLLGAEVVLAGCAVWAVLITLAAGVELLTGGRTRALRWVGAPAWVRRLVLAALGATLVGVPGGAGLAQAAGPSVALGLHPTTSSAGTAAVASSAGTAPRVRVATAAPQTADTPVPAPVSGSGPDGLPLPARPAIERAPEPVVPPSAASAPSFPFGPSSPSSTSSPAPSSTRETSAPMSPVARPTAGAEATRSTRTPSTPTPTLSSTVTSPGGAGNPGSRHATAAHTGSEHPGSEHPGAEPTRAGPTGTTASHAARVTVRAGDTLWALAGRRLPASAHAGAVADLVHRIHDLNRDVIGPDPDLLHPGQRLRVPPSP